MITAYRHKHLQPLELWHGRVGERALYNIPADEFKKCLMEFLRALHAGQAKTESPADTLALRSAAEFSQVLIRGGNSQLVSAWGAEKDLPFQVQIDKSACPFSGWSGAQVIFREQGWANGLSIDLGQSAMKVMHARARSLRLRDLRDFPHAGANDGPEPGRLRLRGWIAETIEREESAHAFRFDGLCLALPVKLNGLEAESCTYPGLFGDLREIFAEGALPRLVIVNDAVLTARGLPRPDRKTLVLTLGWGIGGALWHA